MIWNALEAKESEVVPTDESEDVPTDGTVATAPVQPGMQPTTNIVINNNTGFQQPQQQVSYKHSKKTEIDENLKIVTVNLNLVPAVCCSSS